MSAAPEVERVLESFDAALAFEAGWAAAIDFVSFPAPPFSVDPFTTAMETRRNREQEVSLWRRLDAAEATGNHVLIAAARAAAGLIPLDPRGAAASWADFVERAS